MSPDVLRELYAALDRAEADGAVVVLTGREDVFSAGFDLRVMNRGGPQAIGMLRLGYRLTARVLAYPYPVIAACPGHSMAMGVFLMLSADYIIGSRGDFRISANEVAIGLTMPRVAAAMLKHRLDPAAFQRAVTLSEEFDPVAALDGGPDGLDHVRRLVEDLPRILRVCGAAVLEIGEGQANRVVKLATRAGLGVARHDRALDRCRAAPARRNADCRRLRRARGTRGSSPSGAPGSRRVPQPPRLPSP